jgi:hypothetical protein
MFFEKENIEMWGVKKESRTDATDRKERHVEDTVEGLETPQQRTTERTDDAVKDEKDANQ